MNSAEKNKILIVDDEPSNLRLLTHILNREYSVFAAKDGQTCIEMAKEHRPDLIMLDVVMPEMDGYEALSTLKSSEKTRNIPVIIITGLDTSEENAEKNVKEMLSQAAGCIHKPFNAEIILSKVRRQMEITGRLCAE